MKGSKIGGIIAWIVLAVAALGVAGGLSIAEYGGVLVWCVVGCVAGLVLVARRRRRESAAAAEIAARADAQNEAYLDGDASGVYGQYRPEV